jgi:hypothetical protein
MAGALLGAAGAIQPDGDVADRDYIEREADRMWTLTTGATLTMFPYPDLRHWQPPRSQADSFGEFGGQLHLAGLGPVELAGEVPATSGDNAFAWQWVDLWFGQRMLVKRRSRPPALESSQVVIPSDAYISTSLLDDVRGALPMPPDRDTIEVRRLAGAASSVHALTGEAIESGFDPSLIGHHLLRLSESDQGVELTVAYAAILAKALISRRDRRGGRSS